MTTSPEAQAAGRRAAELATSSETTDGNLSPRRLPTRLASAGVALDTPNASLAPSLCPATTYTRPPEGPYLQDDSIYTRED